MLPPGPRCPASRSRPTSGAMSTRCRTCRIGQAADLVVVAPATADVLARPRTASRTTCSPTPFSPRGARGVRARDAHRDVGARRDHRRTSRRSASAVPWSSSRPRAGSPAVDTGKGGSPSRRRSSTPVARCSPSTSAGRARQGADLAGRHVVVTAGGTREASTPSGSSATAPRASRVRWRAAAARGAEVTLVAANTRLCPTRPG